jgi:hypothetical protein
MLGTAGCNPTVTAFFIPGIGDDPCVVERTYDEMLSQVELELGSRPNFRRIAQLWTRRGSIDCITEVGTPDPVRGGTVIAIFDMGQKRPFVVWWRPDGGMPTGIREILGHNAYSVVEFDS